ncbi:MAG: sulfotransferase [Opitutales bacterium]
MRAWAGAWTKRGRTASPLGARRLAFLLLACPLAALVQGVHWLGFLVDEVCFRGYRRVRVTSPLFITGIPRSGTTFVHRSLAADRAQFTSPTAWEVLLAPSVAERRGWRLLGRLDRALGRPGRRLLDALIARASGEFGEIHAVSLEAPEEDYLTLLPVAGCFLAVLAFPSAESFWRLGRLDTLPPAEQAELLRFYRICLQKHLYVAGPDKQLLSKNAAFASWIPGLRQTFPGARFLVCVREPLGALSSQLSSLEGGCAACGTEADAAGLPERFRATFEHAYRCLAREVEAAPADLAVVDQADLQRVPEVALGAALAHLGVARTADLQHALAEAAAASRAHRSGHHHRPARYGFSKDSIGPCLPRAYASILRAAKPASGEASAPCPEDLSS